MAKPISEKDFPQQNKDSMKEKMFEKIRSDLQKKADQEKQEKEHEERIKKVQEYEKYMQEQRMREEQRREVQDQWEKLKQIQKQQAKERSLDLEKKKEQISINQFRYDSSKEEEDNQRKLEEMYLEDYQNRLKQSKKLKQEFLYSQFKKKEPKQDQVKFESNEQVKEQISLNQEQIELLRSRQQNFQNQDTLSQYNDSNSKMTFGIIAMVIAAFGYLFLSSNKQEPNSKPQVSSSRINMIQGNAEQQKQKQFQENLQREEVKEDKDELQTKRKKIKKDPYQMKTEVKIPIVPAKSDPTWLLKKHAGKKLDPIETEEYYSHQFQKENYYLTSGRHGFEGIPSSSTISSIVVQYHTIKKNCLMSQNLCSMRYNNQVFLGPYDECGKIDIFKAWHDQVKETRARRLIDKFMDQYELPIFVTVGQSKSAINAFFQAKYGMFTCYDSVHHIGAIDFDMELISYWERQPKQIKFIWYMATLYALAVGKLKWSDIEPFRKSFKQGESFRKYKSRNPNHEEQVNELIMNIKCADLFARLEEEDIDSQKQEIIQNLKKKVQFYRNNQNYLIPQEIKQLIEVESEEELERLISEQVNVIQSNDVKKMERKKMTEKRILPQHITNPHQDPTIHQSAVRIK